MLEETSYQQNTSKSNSAGSNCAPVLTARTSIYLWEFLLEILEDPGCSKIARWISKKEGEFVLLNPQDVARQWGIVKRRPAMDKIKMCRAMRYYYKKGLLEKVKGKQFVYKFLQLPYNHPILMSTSTTQMNNPATTLVWNVDEGIYELRK